MKAFISFCIFLFAYSVSDASATEQVTLPAPYMAKFKHAVELLDGYRGDLTSLEAARTELTEVLDANRRYAPAHKEMARYFIMSGYINSLRFKPGSLGASDASLKAAINLDPNYADAFVLGGHLYRLMNQHDKALASLEKAEKLGTKDPWLHNNWADLLVDEGKYEEAAQRYKKILDTKSSNKNVMVSAFEGLINCYIELGKLNQADEIFRKQIAFEPTAAWSYGNYARFLLCQRDDYETAIARARQALSIMNYPNGRYWLASGLYRKWAQSVLDGTPSQGRKIFMEAQAIYLNPDEIAADAPDCAPLGKIAKALGHNEGSKSSVITEAQRQKEAAWRTYYRPPERCSAPTNRDMAVECGNADTLERVEFEAKWTKEHR